MAEIALEVNFPATKTTKQAGVQAASRISVTISQDGKIVIQQDLRRDGDRWKGTFGTAAGTYEIEIAAFKGTKIKWRGETAIVARAGKTSRAVVKMQNVNQIPLANAGENRIVELGLVVELDGSESSDPDQDLLTYRWSASSGIELNDAESAIPRFTASEPGTFRIDLTVNDGMIDSQPDEVVITVLEPNRPPVANAGADQTAEVGDQVRLDGSGSSDPEGDPLGYRWGQIEGPSISLSNSRTDTPIFLPVQAGIYVFALRVSDGEADSDAEVVEITVIEPNRAPLADAGVDQTVAAGATVQLDGSGSSDPDGDALTYQWTAAPGAVLSSNADASPTFTLSDPGTYRFLLTVNDRQTDSPVDEVVVTVVSRAPTNRVPVAEAGLNQSAQAGTVVHLSAEDSNDPDGDVLTYSWKQMDGPSVELANRNTPIATFTPTESGMYRFSLTVNDGHADSSPDEMIIAVVELEQPPGETMLVDLPGGATLDMVWIERGTFMMGFSESGSGSRRSEVTISQGFYLGKYEVTQGQWESVMGSNPSWHNGANRPVEQVAWHDVQSFIHALNEAAGDSLYRLPSEAEWEYACRGGTTTRWSHGDDEDQLGNYAWYGGNNSPDGTKDVGRKLPNPWGLYDMHGNVWEWCQDWYGFDPSDAQVDPTGPASGSHRVVRGGYFHSEALDTRSALRDNYAPSTRYFDVGARLLRMAEPIGTNTPPQANAGSDATIQVGEMIVLDGSGSYDADGDVLSYRWTAPSGAILSITTKVKTRFLATTVGTYTFSLVVNDGLVDGAPDEVRITTVPRNQTPIANAGPDQTIEVGETVTI